MRELTPEELVGTKWAGGPSSGGLDIIGIAQDGRFCVVFRSGKLGSMSLAEIEGMGYWMVCQAPLPVLPTTLTDLADALKLANEHVVSNSKLGFNVLKCKPDCTPAAPCMSAVCPGHLEHTISLTPWARDQYEMWAPIDLPMRLSPPRMPELRCAQEWGCGLARTTR